MEEIYHDNREECKETVKNENLVLAVHFHGVMLETSIGEMGSKVIEKKDRVNVFLKSPLVEKPQFVASQICQDGTGRQVANQACQAVENIGVMEIIWVVV